MTTSLYLQGAGQDEDDDFGEFGGFEVCFMMMMTLASLILKPVTYYYYASLYNLIS